MYRVTSFFLAIGIWFINKLLGVGISGDEYARRIGSFSLASDNSASPAGGKRLLGLLFGSAYTRRKSLPIGVLACTSS